MEASDNRKQVTFAGITFVENDALPDDTLLVMPDLEIPIAGDICDHCMIIAPMTCLNPIRRVCDVL